MFQVWLPSFYLCLECTKLLDTVHTFRDQCIKTDLIRKGQVTIVKENQDTVYEENNPSISVEEKENEIKEGMNGIYLRWDKY